MATLCLEDIDQDYVLDDRKVVTEPSVAMVSAPMSSETFRHISDNCGFSSTPKLPFPTKLQ